MPRDSSERSVTTPKPLSEVYEEYKEDKEDKEDATMPTMKKAAKKSVADSPGPSNQTVLPSPLLAADDEFDEFGESDESDEDDEDDEDHLDPAQLTLERIVYIEKEYGLPGTGTDDERAEAVIKELCAQKLELRKRRNGKISKCAKERCKMQEAWRRSGKYQTPAGSQWRPSFFRSERAWYNKQHAKDSNEEWHIKALAAAQREGAAGGAQIGAKRTLRAHEALRRKQGFDQAFAWFTAEGGGFEKWTIIEFERMLLWGAAEHRIREWGGAQKGSLLWRIAIGAACYFGEKYMLALLYGGTPTPQQDGRHAIYHVHARQEVANVSSELFNSDGSLSSLLIPQGHTLHYQAFQPDGACNSFHIRDRGSLVAALHTLRVGGVDTFGQEVPAPATALGESPELSTRRAQEQADDLAGEKTGRALAPGALAWRLLITDLAPGGASPFQLCGRPGWHTSHMMHRLGLEVPTQPMTPDDKLLQSATDPDHYGKQVCTKSAQAEAQLRLAAAAVNPAETGQASRAVGQLVSLANAHGERVPTRDTDARLKEELEALGSLGLRAEAEDYVRARGDLTNHMARAQVRGGRASGPKTNAECKGGAGKKGFSNANCDPYAAGDTYTDDAGVKLAPGDEGHVAGAGYAHKGRRGGAKTRVHPNVQASKQAFKDRHAARRSAIFKGVPTSSDRGRAASGLGKKVWCAGTRSFKFV